MLIFRFPTPRVAFRSPQDLQTSAYKGGVPPTMRHAHLRTSFVVTFLISALAFTACQQVDKATASTDKPATSGKIAITTSSEEARKEFLAGRDLAENIRVN